MKLRKGQARYKLPPIGMMLQTWVGQGGKYRTRMMVSLQPHEHIQQLPQRTGQPRYFGTAKNRVTFWPTPDKAYVATLRYFPPAQEV